MSRAPEPKWPFWKTALLLFVAAPLTWAVVIGLVVFAIWIF